CNVELEPVDPEDVTDEVPSRVLERTRAFSRCPECGRVYWEGTHTDRMRALVDRVFEEAGRSI
ncbi:MAG: Mut7-C RNAse domain-containing protein, partial [Longimicrobiales bacterium]|nr:Mut7-C RNAse domain-containing protein [Longimicrobiales bacterium]